MKKSETKKSEKGTKSAKLTKNVKHGSMVTILTGKDKGKSGKILRFIDDKNKVVIEGMNTVKKHQRSRKEGAKGQIVDVAMPIHISNIALTK